MRNSKKLSFVLTLVGCASLLASGLEPTPAATALPAGFPEPPEVPVAMGAYHASDYAAEASALPDQLASVIERDLAMSAEHYLAQAASALDATAVLESLADSGITVEGARLEDTRLVVYLPDASDRLMVESTGAEVVIGTPPSERDFSDLQVRPLSYPDLRGGSAYSYSSSGESRRCSVGFNGRSGSSGAWQFATAGHCYGDGAHAELTQTAPSITGALLSAGQSIGSAVSGSFAYGDGYDIGLVGVSEPGWTPRPEVLTWGGGVGAPLATAPLPIVDHIAAITGAPVCKSGATTGWTCGVILDITAAQVGDGTGSTVEVIEVVSDVCMLPGDSGGPALVGYAALGLNSAGNWSGSCDPAGQEDAVSLIFAMTPAYAGMPSVQTKYGTAWEPAVQVSAPAVTKNDGIDPGGALTGSVKNGNLRHSVKVYVDGSSVPITAAVSSAGTWSASVSGLKTGAHSYVARATWGKWSTSTAVSGSFTITGAPAVSRLSGADRYEVAVNVSKEAFPGTAPVVYIVKGSDYPDALSAAPAAVSDGAPLLLTRPDSLPAIVANEIKRLRPQKIVVVGGTGSVTPAVFSQLKTLSLSVVRLGGADRYIAGRAVVDFAFDSAAIAYVATGENFPDALSASAAGGAVGAPVILVRGSRSTLDAASRNLLLSLGVKRIKIAGGPGSVSPGIAAGLSAIAPTIRLGGADRFIASDAISSDAYSTASTVFLTTGYNFPDALAGAAYAGKISAPMYAVKTSCVPQGVLNDIDSLGATRVVLLGGPGTLTSAVASLKPC